MRSSLVYACLSHTLLYLNLTCLGSLVIRVRVWSLYATGHRCGVVAVVVVVVVAVVVTVVVVIVVVAAAAEVMADESKSSTVGGIASVSCIAVYFV